MRQTDWFQFNFENESIRREPKLEVRQVIAITN